MKSWVKGLPEPVRYTFSLIGAALIIYSIFFLYGEVASWIYEHFPWVSKLSENEDIYRDMTSR